MPNSKKDHERMSKERICNMQRNLDEFVKKHDPNDLGLLSLILDAQLKLEDYRIRFRESQHAKIKVWGPLILPAIVSIVVSLIVAWVTYLKK
jgi:hypothetical protein